jgi:hypothetical protein
MERTQPCSSAHWARSSNYQLGTPNSDSGRPDGSYAGEARRRLLVDMGFDSAELQQTLFTPPTSRDNISVATEMGSNLIQVTELRNLNYICNEITEWLICNLRQITIQITILFIQLIYFSRNVKFFIVSIL